MLLRIVDGNRTKKMDLFPMKVTLADGRTFVGVVEDADVGSDLATVRIQASGLPTMKVSSCC